MIVQLVYITAVSIDHAGDPCSGSPAGEFSFLCEFAMRAPARDLFLIAVGLLLVFHLH